MSVFEVQFVQKNTFLELTTSVSGLCLNRSQTTSLCNLSIISSPRSSVSSVASTQKAQEESVSMPTTVMVRNIPHRVSQNEFVAEVLSVTNKHEIQPDFIFLPIHRENKNRTYGFVNFACNEDAKVFMKNFKNYIFVNHPDSKKKATTTFAKRQGKADNMEMWRSMDCPTGLWTL